MLIGSSLIGTFYGYSTDILCGGGGGFLLLAATGIGGGIGARD
jgi:hypothetical protein